MDLSQGEWEVEVGVASPKKGFPPLLINKKDNETKYPVKQEIDKRV